MRLQGSSRAPVIACVLAMALWRPQLLRAQSTPLVVSTTWLSQHLHDPDLVLLQIGSRMGRQDAEHIPGARLVSYMSLIEDVGGVSSELPSADSLRTLFERVGVSDNSHVVLTGPPLAVTRAFYTLEYLGHPRVSALTGGLTKWKAEKKPVVTDGMVFAAGNLTPRKPRTEIVATTDWVRQHAGKPGVSLFDTRTEEEYLGTHGSAGHIQGARRIEWHEFLTDDGEFVLADQQTLMRLWVERLNAPTDTIVAYCAVGYRASGTYFVSRLLGLPVKLYDGSYDAWSRQNLPVVRTVTPLYTPPPARNTGGGLPFVSPDGRYIAYVATRDAKQGDVYVVRADGGKEARITNTARGEGAPVWLGNRVLTWVNAGDTTKVSATNPDGTGWRSVATFAGENYREIRPSPDGRRLLYSHGPWPNTRLAVSNLDGSGARDITDGTSSLFNAAWSPDGKRIAYTFFDSSRLAQVGVMNADGTNRRVLTHFTAADGGAQWPSWSPDGKRLAVQLGKYSRENRASNTAHILIIDVASAKVTKLAAHDRPYMDETPSWFPDGKRIAFQSDRTGVMQVWVMNADGTGARQVTSWSAATASAAKVRNYSELWETRRRMLLAM